VPFSSKTWASFSIASRFSAREQSHDADVTKLHAKTWSVGGGTRFFGESLRSLSLDRRKMMIEPGHPRLSIVRQCELASISRSSFYREPNAESEETLRLMRLIDEQFLETPWYGSRQMARHLRRNGWCAGRHRVRRLMTKMGLAPSDLRGMVDIGQKRGQSAF
jgi:putative transposase